MSSVNAFTHQRLSNTRVVSMAQIHSVTPLPIENCLSQEEYNNRHLLEKAIIFKQQGLFTTPIYQTVLQTSHHMASNLIGSFLMFAVELQQYSRWMYRYIVPDVSRYSHVSHNIP